MRVDIPLLSQSLIEASKVPEKKDVTKSTPKEPSEESHTFVPSPLGLSGTYSLSSLRAAVEYHAKLLTVAENNLEAANHPARIPQLILDRLNAKQL